MTERVAGEVMVYQAITILEITERGMRIEAPFPLQNDSLHEFRLILSTRSIVVKGRTIRCEVGELREGNVLYRCHIEFVDPALHVRDTIRDFVTAHHAPPPQVIEGEISDES